MKKILFALLLTAALAGCESVYQTDVMPASEQNIEDAKTLQPQSSLQQGVFHMQRVEEGSPVRVREQVLLKRPDLPPFDVAYINRDIEEVILELANAAGESVVIPQGLRGKTVTLVNSGADFPTMMELVLSRAGYYYNYVNGVWYVTRYPIRNYVLELSQSTRKGSLLSPKELSPEDSAGQSATAGASELATEYADDIWTQTESALSELVNVGSSGGGEDKKSESIGGTTGGSVVGVAPPLTQLPELLPPPVLGEGSQTQAQASGTIQSQGVTPTVDVLAAVTTPEGVQAPQTNDHMVPEEDAKPWFRITKSAGLITVRAAPEAHRLIEEYLSQVQNSAHRQIMVEARIVAVTRDKTTDRGANLTKKFDPGDSYLGRLGFTANTALSTTTAKGFTYNIFSSKRESGNMNLIIAALAKFGDVFTISSPTLLARNNQLSRVSITKQLGYAETQVDQNTTGTGEVVVGSRVDTPKFKNSGTVMSVMPFIGKSRVQMRVRLSIATQSGTNSIQTIVGTGANQQVIPNDVPELANNVVDQDMVLEYGRVYAIGSLVETSTTLDESFAPGLDQIPGLSEVFKRANNRKQDTEFLVFIRVARA